jgi:aminoglycoside phosphotransferase (APT) family kinase protein
MSDTAIARNELDFDPAALEPWLRETLPDARGPMRVQRIGGGQSNPTYFVHFDTLKLVLRKRPPGELPKSTHDMGREYRILRALHGTAVPVPQPVLYREQSDIVGTPFYLMRQVDGRVFHDSRLPEVPRAERRAYYRELVRVLAALHTLDWRSTGLASFARPGRYLVRQVERWAKAWGPAALDDPQVSRVVRWLGANIPESEDQAIVHGDYKMNNALFHPAQPELLAIFDWELCAIGDPLSDLAHAWSFTWGTAPEDYGGLQGTDLEAAGLPSPEEFFAEYYAVSGTPRRVTPFHLALAHFRTAGIFHGIAERAASGSANAANAEQKGRLDRVYVARALEIARRHGG